jgi:hypothetical protein
MIQTLILIEGLSFVLAALTHFGVITSGYEHQKAGTAETVIGVVLLVGLVLTLVRPQSLRPIALGVQGFALLGTFVGLFTIAIGVGPQTTPDFVYHGTIVTLLIIGLVITYKSQRVVGQLS